MNIEFISEFSYHSLDEIFMGDASTELSQIADRRAHRRDASGNHFFLQSRYEA